MNGVAIRNYKIKGLPGGWAVVLDLKGRSIRFDGSPEKIFYDVKQFMLGNKIYKSDRNIWDMLNDIWCTRCPERCLKEYREVERFKPKPTLGRRKVLSREDYGPTIWKQLNYFTVYFKRDLVLAYIKWVEEMLDPKNLDNFNAGCSICHGHFKELLYRHPIEQVKDKYDMARWVVTVHNEVNVRLGKRKFTYGQLVSEYGGPTIEE